MMNPINTTQLRSNIYNILDTVIETGVPVEISRNGYVLKIVVEEKKSKVANLKPQDIVVGDPNDLIDLQVSEWDEKIHPLSI